MLHPHVIGRGTACISFLLADVFLTEAAGESSFRQAIPPDRDVEGTRGHLLQKNDRIRERGSRSKKTMKLKIMVFR